MIYDPITRQAVKIIGRYPPQDHSYHQFVGKVKGDFRFVKLVYGEHRPGFSGGFKVGAERDLDINSLVADGGLTEILEAYEAAPNIDSVMLRA